MIVSSDRSLQHLNAAKGNVKNYKPFTLVMAAGSADPKNRKSAGTIFVTNIFEIPANASNVDAAWISSNIFIEMTTLTNTINPPTLISEPLCLA